MDQRWRDGSIKEATFTDPTGYYQYPTAEGGALGRWIINEQGFARFSAYPGAVGARRARPARYPSCASTPTSGEPVRPDRQGGGLLTNQLLTEGHRATVDWGKRDYPAGTPGQIVGITYFSTTRNEFDARFQAHEDYEPAIPDVTVYLERPRPGRPAEHRRRRHREQVRHRPLAAAEREPGPADRPATRSRQSCDPIRDFTGADISAPVQPGHRAELPRGPAHRRADQGRRVRRRLRLRRLLPERLRPGRRRRHLRRRHATRSPLVAGTTSPTWSCRRTAPTPAPATRPSDRLSGSADAKGARARRRHRLPLPPGPRGGRQRRPRQPVHAGRSRRRRAPATTTSSTSRRWSPRSNYFGVAGAHAPLCDKRLVVLQNSQNANADFNLMTNFRTDPNGEDADRHPDR